VPLLWTVPLPLPEGAAAPVSLLLVATDMTPDGRPRYDTVAQRLSSSEAWTYHKELDWFSLEQLARGADDDRPYTYGSWTKVMRLERFRGQMRLFMGPFYRLLAYPEAFRAELEQEVGFWPGPPDQWLLGDWWLDATKGIDLDTFLEQLVRLDRWLDQVSRHVIENHDFRLLLAYHPAPDEYQHMGLIVDPRQWAYSPGRAVAAAEGLKQVGASMDDSVADAWQALDPSRDALVVLSDHGLVPIHDQVAANRVLADAGLTELVEEGGRLRVADSSPMRAISAGACAHLYLNLEGREPGGVVSQQRAPELLHQAARAFARLEEDGLPLIEQIFTREEAAEVGLRSPNSGDLVLFVRPGYTFSMFAEGEPVQPTRYYGQHGHLSHHDALAAIFFARGAGIPDGRRKELQMVQVAPLVASWLGLPFPR
jgi:hypothetical protein